jgi:hypothetical protein
MIPSFSFVNVLTDFLTIMRYRKNDINKILSEHIEIPFEIRAVLNLLGNS